MEDLRERQEGGRERKGDEDSKGQRERGGGGWRAMTGQRGEERKGRLRWIGLS